MEISKIYLTNNDCYKSGKTIVPKGIVVHSTGANNKTLKRYVQPDDGTIGTNPNHNDWNRTGVSKCVHAFIGVDKNGRVRAVQTLPWNYRCWGCGSGSRGSYNNSYIQFEICEDALTDPNYFIEAMNMAQSLCAYLCKTYGISVDNVVSHHEAHLRGYASNHGDCDHWLKNFGKDMNWFRTCVASILNISTVTAYTHSDFVKEVQSAIGVKVDGIAGANTLSKTITVSAKKNYKHKVVKPIQKYLNSIGYDCGTADGIAGAKFENAVRKFQSANGCVADGEVTAKQKTWKKLLKL